MSHEIAEDVSAQVGRRIQPTFGYYRQPNGWITVSPITRMERVKYGEEGWTSLDQYGAFDMSPYVAAHPFEGLLMFGGAKEMPVDQIIQMSLHLNPPRVPACRQHLTQFHRAHNAACWNGATTVRFPQLAGLPAERLQPYRCEFCSRVLPTPEARNQHQQVAHKEERNNIQAGRSLATAIAQNGSSPVDRPSPAPGDEERWKRLAELEAADTARREKLREKAKKYNRSKKAATKAQAA